MINPDSLPSFASPSLRVLIVDDQPDLLTMLDLMMQRRQYAVKTAQSGDHIDAKFARQRWLVALQIDCVFGIRCSIRK